jgi:hypothetical protein
VSYKNSIGAEVSIKVNENCKQEILVYGSKCLPTLLMNIEDFKKCKDDYYLKNLLKQLPGAVGQELLYTGSICMARKNTSKIIFNGGLYVIMDTLKIPKYKSIQRIGAHAIGIIDNTEHDSEFKVCLVNKKKEIEEMFFEKNKICNDCSIASCSNHEFRNILCKECIRQNCKMHDSPSTNAPEIHILKIHSAYSSTMHNVQGATIDTNLFMDDDIKSLLNKTDDKTTAIKYIYVLFSRVTCLKYLSLSKDLLITIKNILYSN